MMINQNRVIWITWENQLRNRSMASKLNIKLYKIDLPVSRIKRYILGLVKTLLLIRKNNPRAIIAQNPSIVLTIIMVLFRPLWGYRFISDSHFGGVTAYNGSKLFQKALNFCNRMADLVIVTNSEQANYIKSIGGKSFVCEDPLPDISRYINAEAEVKNVESEDKLVFFICSFDIDEPYAEVFKSADLLAGDKYKICVSGNYKKANIQPEDYPHIYFLGYLPEHLFYEKLFKSHIVVDLTTHENCLLCGAYEAMAAEKPLVTSDKQALRQYFRAGTVFTKHDREQIAHAIMIAFERREVLKMDIREWKKIADLENDSKIKKLHELIEAWL